MKEYLEKLSDIPNKKTNPLNYVFENKIVIDKGLWLEFGVYSGKTINYISKNTVRTVYGFDSFQGLPEDWVRADGGYKKGKFNTHGKIPTVNNNVMLVKGFFDCTLPTFIETHLHAVYFIHIDCDIYSSTKAIFDLLSNKIAPGCVIVFDELINYPNFEQHEWKAWWEFVVHCNVEFEWLCMNGEIQIEPLIDLEHDQKVAVRVINNPAFKKKFNV